MTKLSLVSTFIGLLSITNPIGNIPLFLRFTEGYTPDDRRRTAVLVGLAVFVTLAVAQLAGRQILALFDIDLNAFRFAGDLVVITIAWSMLTAAPTALLSPMADEEIPIVPLAIPLLAGPGAISFVISSSAEHRGVAAWLLGVAVIAANAITVIMLFLVAPLVRRVLGRSGLDILTRIFGLLLLAIAIGGLFNVLVAVFPGLRRS